MLRRSSPGSMIRDACPLHQRHLGHFTGRRSRLFRTGAIGATMGGRHEAYRAHRSARFASKRRKVDHGGEAAACKSAPNWPAPSLVRCAALLLASHYRERKSRFGLRIGWVPRGGRGPFKARSIRPSHEFAPSTTRVNAPSFEIAHAKYWVSAST